MRSLLIAFVIGVSAATLVAPVTAQAHWRRVHRVWHHVWRPGPSYYPAYAAYSYSYFLDPYAPACAWRREWDGFWHRDCF
jgi:hypothetical protein